jgi:hypothetical protein
MTGPGPMEVLHYPKIRRGDIACNA